MAHGDPRNWMWSEAVEMLSRAERMHREVFSPRSTRAQPIWEPPVDVLETDQEILIFIALPGIAPEQVEAAIEGSTVLVSGRRVLPPQLRTAIIHRLELPQGRFERRIPLPPGRYDSIARTASDGCMLISLHKAR
ncbi:MAG: heat-shock protein Hsp20 [Hyphomicrobiales bacterium]|nr:heat-shock protein Hsp20 [Hyphomicrobiales bacterium]